MLYNCSLRMSFREILPTTWVKNPSSPTSALCQKETFTDFLSEKILSPKLGKEKGDKALTKKSKLVYDLPLLRTTFALLVVYV